MVTKTETPHVVLLAGQANATLRKVHPVTGHNRYVFPNARYPHREKSMRHGTLRSAFRALDIPRDRMTMHGFRAMARTILDEALGFRPTHAVRDPNGRASNRTKFLPERRHTMQVWADNLDRLRVGEEIELEAFASSTLPRPPGLGTPTQGSPFPLADAAAAKR